MKAFKSHGDAWQDIAYAVEKGAKEFFGLDLELGREWVYVLELASRPYVRRSKKLREWGFDEEVTKKQIRSCLWGSSSIGFGGKKTCSITRFYYHSTMESGKAVDGEGDDGSDK